MSLLRSFVLAALIVSPRVAVGQQATGPAGPPGWNWSLDQPAVMSAGGKALGTDSLFEFALMAPGWHLTMGPGGVVFDPREQADHRYWLTAELILFPDASADGEYGIFAGGRALESASGKQWFAFVVRGDGSAAVMHRAGAETRMVMPWTKHAAVKTRSANATVTNVVQLRAEADSIGFLVNGERITSFARSALDVNGLFGIRAGEGANLHVTNLDVTRRLAPAPRRR